MFRLRTAFALLLAAALAGCAAPQLSATRDAMPAARAGLRPEYRIFYDALQDYGDWVLIEPYGFVFRPSVNVAQWRPYMDGFWAPSDLYGWVWISAEPFGWATYHYGRWMYDPYQRWVWIPGADWAPAWVSWEQSGDYVGWSPLMASGGTNPPGGAYTWAPMGQLGGTNLRANTASTAQLGEAVAHPEPVSNPDTHGGVTFDRGPDFSLVERRAGPLRRVRIDDLVPGAPASPAAHPTTPNGGTTAPKSGFGTVELTKRAAVQSAREASTAVQNRAPLPVRVGLVRPIGVSARERHPASLPDTTR